MIDRFGGHAGRPVLINALLTQTLVQGDLSLAEAIADLATLRTVDSGANLIVQGAPDSDVFLILSGAFTVIINGRHWRIRTAGDHVGEMSAVEPSQPRSATVQATELSVVAALTRTQFWHLAERHSNIWRVVAKELSRRLNQQNAHIKPIHHKPDAFVISSSESLPIARALKTLLQNAQLTVSLWNEGIFAPSTYALDVLEDAFTRSDFAIVIADGNDVVTSRRKRRRTPRDNVTFELGLAVGYLGRKRTFLLLPRLTPVTLASDLLGLTTIRYDWNPLIPSLEQIATAAALIQARVLDLGPA